MKRILLAMIVFGLVSVLAGGCDWEHLYEKSMNGTVYFFEDKGKENEMVVSYKGSAYNDRMWSSGVKIVPEDEVEKLKNYVPSFVSSSDQGNKSCYVFVVAKREMKTWDNFQLPVQLSVGEEQYCGVISIPHLNHPYWKDDDARMDSIRLTLTLL